ncbi:hypothetical protein KVD00_03335 [Helicobacter pylori]|nr:hypothetical protein KVD00_03335 [Helicobacter pylori]
MLLENSRKKIIESNCNKALKVVEELQNTIKTTIEKRIDPGIKETQEYQQEARFNHPKQKSQSSLAVGMNATNSWYHIPIHSYLAQEVCKVTPLEI